ncbi:copper chaperone PCu(A)C [Bradyrhizobium sp. RDI18]|uniref:copper chaperone PCu(A)C n=1 Tax=Bradyrhizobium sp. RDI18 TaxID=3367400 RepID=UPI003717DE0A
METSKIKAAFLGIMLASLCAVTAQAADLTVRHAWSRATPKGAQVAGGYLTIDNLGNTSDRLLSALSEAARKVEIHETIMQDGIMMMRTVDDGLRVAPGETMTLEPGGTHIMFIGLTSPLSEGQQVPVSLFFEHAGKVDAIFDVGTVGAKGPRLLLASTRPAVHPVLTQERASESFFTHICGTELMANVTVSPGKSGPVELTIQLEDADEKPLVAQALTVTLSSPDKEIAPVAAPADRISSDTWKVRMSATAAGKWSLALSVQTVGSGRIDIAAPILIE